VVIVKLLLGYLNVNKTPCFLNYLIKVPKHRTLITACMLLERIEAQLRLNKLELS